MSAIRIVTPGDAGSVLDIYRPIVLETPISFEYEPPSVEEMRRRIERTLATYPWLVSTNDAGEVEGYAYATALRSRTAYRWSVEVSAYVRPDRRQRRIGRALYQALCAALERQGFVSAYAGIALPNAESVRFHERLGFHPIGVFPRVGFKHGRWYDIGWWRRALSDPPSDPSPPTPFSELTDGGAS